MADDTVTPNEQTIPNPEAAPDRGSQTTAEYFREHLERQELGIEAPMW